MKTFRCALALAVALLALTPATVGAGIDLPALLGDPELTYDPAVAAPAAELGFEPGEWHVRPDQVVFYMERLAATSKRVRLDVQGHTHERRPQILLTLSSPANLARLDRILSRHRELSEPTAGEPSAEDLDRLPVVVWLGYSVHGNEASGANAALLVAYHLAAAESRQVEELLEDTVVLLDPMLNPDGLGRFAQWVNQHRGSQPVGAPASREHQEPWPGGRTNHYWFDLNRDWLLLQHPESRARVATLQRWRPNVVADFHEMGSESTFFFQPGVPSRKNPLTPDENVRLTAEIARHHAAALDRLGRLYYTEETFDDFYYGKGSTYPDIQGAVGILFEQASVRAHVRDTAAHGRREFTFAVENQLLTSLSTLEGAARLREELLAHQARFYRQAREQASRSPLAGWVFGAPGDPASGHEMLEILAAHGVEARRLAAPLSVDGRRFAPGEAWLVPVDQRQFLLAKSLFEAPVEFPDTTFYDVSTWNLPMAMGLPWAAVPRADFDAAVLGGPAGTAFPSGTVGLGESPYAYVFDWRGLQAPRALARLLASGGRARVATRLFTAETSAGRRAFGYGTVIVPLGDQELLPEELAGWAAAAAEQDGLTVHTLSTGLTGEGVDLGSPSIEPLTAPRPALVVGDGVSGYDAGEAWHLMDHRLGLEVPLLPVGALGQADLGAFTHLVLVDGRYQLDEPVRQRLAAWVRNGGVLIAVERAGEWAARDVLGLEKAEMENEPEAPEATAESDPPVARRAYADYEAERAVELVSGSIFEVDLDLTHPLAFGLGEPHLPTFRTHERVMEPSENPYENVALYTARPLLAGYASGTNVERIAGSGALCATRVGRGAFVRFAFNPNFRGIWRGTQKLFTNALFFAPVLKETRSPQSWLSGS